MKLGNRKTAGMKADNIETAKGSGQCKALEGLQANPHLKWGCLTWECRENGDIHKMQTQPEQLESPESPEKPVIKEAAYGAWDR